MKGMDKADSIESRLREQKSKGALSGPYVCPICEQDTLKAWASTSKTQKVGKHLTSGKEYRYVVPTRIHKYLCGHCGFKETMVVEGLTTPDVDVYCQLYDKHRKDTTDIPSLGRPWP